MMQDPPWSNVPDSWWDFEAIPVVELIVFCDLPPVSLTVIAVLSLFTGGHEVRM